MTLNGIVKVIKVHVLVRPVDQVEVPGIEVVDLFEDRITSRRKEVNGRDVYRLAREGEHHRFIFNSRIVLDSGRVKVEVLFLTHGHFSVVLDEERNLNYLDIVSTFT